MSVSDPKVRLERIGEAARTGDIDTVAQCIRAAPTESDEHEYALIQASAAGQLDIVDQLLATGINSHVEDLGGPDAPLRHACAGGHQAVVRSLIASRILRTSLQYCILNAIKNGHSGVVEELIRAGADIPKSALYDAAMSGHAGMVDFILYQNAWGKSEKERALVGAARRGHNSVVERLLQETFDTHFDLEQAISGAIESEHRDIVIQIAERIICSKELFDLNHLITIASGYGQEKIIDDLLGLGAEPTPHALCEAVEEAHRHIVNRLIRAGVSRQTSDANLNQPLALAVENLNEEIVIDLIQAGAEPMSLPPGPRRVILHHILERAGIDQELKKDDFVENLHPDQEYGERQLQPDVELERWESYEDASIRARELAAKYGQRTIVIYRDSVMDRPQNFVRLAFAKEKIEEFYRCSALKGYSVFVTPYCFERHFFHLTNLNVTLKKAPAGNYFLVHDREEDDF